VESDADYGLEPWSLAPLCASADTAIEENCHVVAEKVGCDDQECQLEIVVQVSHRPLFISVWFSSRGRRKFVFLQVVEPDGEHEIAPSPEEHHLEERGQQHEEEVDTVPESVVVVD